MARRKHTRASEVVRAGREGFPEEAIRPEDPMVGEAGLAVRTSGRKQVWRRDGCVSVLCASGPWQGAGTCGGHLSQVSRGGAPP